MKGDPSKRKKMLSQKGKHTRVNLNKARGTTELEAEVGSSKGQPSSKRKGRIAKLTQRPAEERTFEKDKSARGKRTASLN